MGLFDKKVCEFCGGAIGFLGNKKLADGNMCKDCAAKMSPYLTARKKWTVADMTEHFAYREANQIRVNSFQTIRVMGIEEKVYLDMANAQWLVSRHNNFAQYNPDVFNFNQVTGCNIDIKETKNEIHYRNQEGHLTSFFPKEYEYEYNFYVEIYVNSPFVDTIRIKINDKKVEFAESLEYAKCITTANNIKYVFDQMMSGYDAITVPDDFMADPSTVSMYSQATEMQRQRIRALKNYKPGMAIPTLMGMAMPHVPVQHGAPHPGPNHRPIAPPPMPAPHGFGGHPATSKPSGHPVGPRTGAAHANGASAASRAGAPQGLSR